MIHGSVNLINDDDDDDDTLTNTKFILKWSIIEGHTAGKKFMICISESSASNQIPHFA